MTFFFHHNLTEHVSKDLSYAASSLGNFHSFFLVCATSFKPALKILTIKPWIERKHITSLKSNDILGICVIKKRKTTSLKIVVFQKGMPLALPGVKSRTRLRLAVSVIILGLFFVGGCRY